MITYIDQTRTSVASAPISHRMARGSAWTVGARVASRLIDLLTMLVLARLLSPKDFGLVAIAMTLVTIVEAAMEMPIAQALVRLATITQEDYDTAFTLSMLRGIVLTAFLCASSIPFASFYGDARLVSLVCCLSLAPVTRGLTSPRMADYTKQLSFGREFTMEVGGKVLAFAVASGIAILFRSYWSIALCTIVAPAGNAAISYVFAPYRPRLSLARSASLTGFLGWFTIAQLLSAFNWQSDRLLLGRITSAADLGLFSNANDLATIPQGTLTGAAMRPLLAAFSLVCSDRERLASSYSNSAIAVVTLGLPILIGESILARPLIQLLFGRQWLAETSLLRLLAMSIIPSLFAMPLGYMVMALGQTHVFVRRNGFELCVKLPLLAVGAIKFHFYGVIGARMISEMATVLYSMVLVRRLVGLSLTTQAFAPWRSLMSALTMTVVLSTVVPKWDAIGSMGSMFRVTVAMILLGALSYLGTLFSLWKLTGCPKGIEAVVMHRIFRHG
jgi:O-antigen/teichoic acid export membrane protein